VPVEDRIKNLEKEVSGLLGLISDLNNSMAAQKSMITVKKVDLDLAKDANTIILDYPELNSNPNAKVFVQMNSNTYAHSVQYSTYNNKWFIAFHKYITSGIKNCKGTVCDVSGKTINAEKVSFSIMIVK
jgi:hypothetical protein